MRFSRLVLLLLCASAHGAQAQPQAFNTALLSGEWAESVRNAYGCRADNVHHRFELSADRKHLLFKLDRPWRIGSGPEVREYGAAVLRESANMLVIRYDDKLIGLPAGMCEWQLLFIGPGTYRWRATFWRDGMFNDVVGVKCGP